MKNYKARDKKLNKKKYGMRISGRSLRLIEHIKFEKSIQAKKENKNISTKLESNNIN